MIVPIASGCRHKWAAGELEQESGMAHPNKDEAKKKW